MLPVDYAVRNLGRSPVRLALSLFGSTLVVLLAIAAAGFVRGMSKSLAISGSERNVMLLGAGSEESVERSEIQPAVPGLVGAGVMGIRQRLGVAYVSPEVQMQTTVKTEPDMHGNPQVLVRGVTNAAYLVHAQVSVVEGRAPLPGRDEILVGKLAPQKLGIARRPRRRHPHALELGVNQFINPIRRCQRRKGLRPGLRHRHAQHRGMPRVRSHDRSVTQLHTLHRRP